MIERLANRHARILEQIAAAPELNNIEPLVALVDTLRPAKHAPIESAAARVETLIALLQTKPPYATLRHYMLRILSTKQRALKRCLKCAALPARRKIGRPTPVFPI